MIYPDQLPALFADRPNRFIARVWTEEGKEEVHVKNTGRLKELLTPGALVTLTEGKGEGRRTRYDLISVAKPGLGWVNIDSQAPNLLMKEWLEEQGCEVIRPEYRYGASRLDFYAEMAGEKWLIEVKGCTLEQKGVGYFPDAPSERAVKHLGELAASLQEGYRAAIAFVIPMEGVTEVRANAPQDPAFAKALALAEIDGVEVWFLPCQVEAAEVRITDCIVKGRENS